MIIEVVVVLPCVPHTAMPRPGLHEPGQSLSPFDDQDAAPAGLLELHIVRRDGGRDDHHVRVVQVGGLVADGSRDPRPSRAGSRSGKA